MQVLAEFGNKFDGGGFFHLLDDAQQVKQKQILPSFYDSAIRGQALASRPLSGSLFFAEGARYKMFHII